MAPVMADGSMMISTHALRVEGDMGRNLMEPCIVISTHALRVEGDLPQQTQ